MVARVALALALTACASAPPVVEEDPKPPDEPPLIAVGGDVRPPLERVSLANGLEAYLLPDRGAPLVCVQVWVKVGSVDEHEGDQGPGSGITGLSHFFEHLMFQGTERFANYDLALAPLGAKNNAFTYHDATVYWVYTPKEHLAHVLDIEADRFENMKVDFVHLEPEREVVKSERRQNVDADPGELAEERAIMRTFDRFPYRWGPIGWMKDLDSVPLETAQRYHAEHYTTTGAYLVIAGDFDPAEAKGMIESTWGKLARPATRPRPSSEREVLAPNETWVGPRTDHLIRPVAQQMVYWSYRAPAPSGFTLRDYAALELIDHALTAGKAGRLGRKLVFSDEPRVSNLWARLLPLRHPFAYVWRADLLPGVTTADVEAVLDSEIAAIQRDGLSVDELARAVATLRADAVRSNLSNSDKAETIGFSIASTGEPFAIYDRLEVYPTITAAEIASVATEYLTPRRRVRVVVVSPARLVALATQLAESDPAAGPLTPMLTTASELFVRALDLQRQRAELDREERAIALLKQRGDVALKAATSAADKAAIRSYLRDNEMGSRLRRERLREQDRTLRAAEAELATKQERLRRALNKEIRTGPANRAANPLTLAIGLLAAPLDRHIAAPMLAPIVYADLAGAQSLALSNITGFALEARGLRRSANEARKAVLVHGPALLEAKGLAPRARALAAAAIDLAADTVVENIALSDTPLPSVKRTTRRRSP